MGNNISLNSINTNKQESVENMTGLFYPHPSLCASTSTTTTATATTYNNNNSSINSRNNKKIPSFDSLADMTIYTSHSIDAESKDTFGHLLDSYLGKGGDLENLKMSNMSQSVSMNSLTDLFA